MPVEPVLMADILKRKSPSSPVDKHRAAIGAGNYNRFQPLISRPRIPSVKRVRTSDSDSADQAKIPKLDSQVIFAQLKDHDTCMNSAKDALTGAAAAIKAACKEDDGGIGTALSKIYSAVEQLVSGSEVLKSALLDLCNNKEKVSKPRNNLQPPGEGNGPSKGGSTSRARLSTAPTHPSQEQKVKKALHDAERKMIVFDLDLGTAPIINKKTISEKVTISLHGKSKDCSNMDAKDAGTMVDDVLSCSTLEFLGSGTRSFYNRRRKDDPRNNKFCTVPVRFEFQNKDTRTQAEQALRRVCKVKPSIPYPKKLRNMINETISKGKAANPDTFIRTKVDIEKLVVMGLIRDSSTGKWKELKDLTQAIPLDILEKSSAISQVDLDSDMEVFTQIIEAEASQASL